MAEFRAWPKIARLNRDVIITEKIDGTNACVIIEQGTNDIVVTAQSRSRIITPEQDNYGFAKWVEANREALIADLGFGYHYGEWWGQGIQRKYGLDSRRFSLFNTTRWEGAEFTTPNLHVVPVLYKGPFDTWDVEDVLDSLKYDTGSVASPGFMKPEGIVIYHTASNTLFKVTCENDSEPKSKAVAA